MSIAQHPSQQGEIDTATANINTQQNNNKVTEQFKIL